MRLATLTLSVVLTLALANAASAQLRYYGYQPSPAATFGGPTFGGSSYFANPYFYQQHPIYNYMPYGYGGYPLGGYPFGGVYPYAYSVPSQLVPYSASTAQDFSPPARKRPSLYPAIPLSEFAADERQLEEQSRGYLTITVPTPGSKLWINDRLMTQGGLERHFQTPLLESATKNYTFEIKVGWKDELGERTQRQEIQVRAGETKSLSFPTQNR